VTWRERLEAASEHRLLEIKIGNGGWIYVFADGLEPATIDVDAFYKVEDEEVRPPRKCECGAAKVGGGHLSYCDLFISNMRREA
jgi:hypothetical protein